MESQREPTAAPGPITRRLVYALALVPIVPASAGIGLAVIDNVFGVGDELRVFHLLFALLWVPATIVIWRRVIVWTLGRKWLTALVGMIPFIQVFYGQPLWDIQSGCLDLSTELLRQGQHDLGVGFYVWLTIWIWWGWEKTHMSDSRGEARPPALRFTSAARRLAVSIGSVPFVVGVFWIIAAACEDFLGAGMPNFLVFLGTSVVAAAVWILIWRRDVLWTGPVIRRTVVIALVTLILPSAGTVFLGFAGGFVDAALGLAPVIGWGVWMGWTVHVWRGRGLSFPVGGDGPCCLACGYPLVGLRSTRCPECGDERTLDELWSASMGW